MADDASNPGGYRPDDPRYGLSGQALQDYYVSRPAHFFIRAFYKPDSLELRETAMDAHLASEAAHQQGKFWQMHDMIFEFQREMSPERYVEYAEKIGMDVDRYKKDLASAKVKAIIDADSAAAAKLGVTGTPAFFVNGRYLSGAQPFTSFKRLIDEELKKKQG